MGAINPILISEVSAYLSLVGIDTQWERLKYLRIVQLLDSVYLAEANRKMEAKNKKPSK